MKTHDRLADFVQNRMRMSRVYQPIMLMALLRAVYLYSLSAKKDSRAEGSEERRLAVFRRVRDEIRERIEQELMHDK